MKTDRVLHSIFCNIRDEYLTNVLNNVLVSKNKVHFFISLCAKWIDLLKNSDNLKFWTTCVYCKMSQQTFVNLF